MCKKSECLQFFLGLVIVPHVTTLFQSPKTISKHPIILIVSFDGMPAERINIVDTPTLDALRGEGPFVPYLEPVFPVKTFPNHLTMTTGLLPERHGVVDNRYFDATLNKSFDGFAETPGFWNSYDDQILPIWILNELAGDDRVSGTYLWPGSHPPYGKHLNLLPTYHVPNTNETEKVPWNERVETVISWMLDDSKPANLVLLYYSEPDEIAHTYGTDDPRYSESIKQTDNRAAYLVEKLKEAGIYDLVNLILVSDHGATTLTLDNVITVTPLFSNHLVKHWYGGSVFFNLMPQKGKGEELYRTLQKHSSDKKYKVWKKNELCGYPYEYCNSRRVFDYVVIAEPGYVFDDFLEAAMHQNMEYNRTVTPKSKYGTHGYTSLVPSMRAIFIARGPAFEEGTTARPFRSIDIFPLLGSILGIDLPSNNGSMTKVQSLLRPKELSDNSINCGCLLRSSLTMISLVISHCLAMYSA